MFFSNQQQPSATSWLLDQGRGVTALIFQLHFKVLSGYHSSLFSSNHHILKQKTETELRKYIRKLTVKKKKGSKLTKEISETHYCHKLGESLA